MRTVIKVILCIAVFMAFAASAVAQKARRSVPASEVNGTFRMNFTGKFRDQSNEIQIASVGSGKLRVAMNLIHPYLLYDGARTANLGDLNDEFSIVGDIATYTSGECTITIKFTRPGLIRVRQKGSDADCGFGHNVTANGAYRRVSSKKPQLGY